MDEENNKILGELLIEMGNGNRNALTEIATRIERLLRTIGNVYYRNRADVEDAIHDTYVRLLFKAKLFRKNTNACAWIVRIFENIILTHLRERNQELEYYSQNAYGVTSFMTVVDERYIENHLFLREIFDKLTEKERRLIIYYFWCKCSIREVAEIVHMPKSTIHVKIKELEVIVKDFNV